MDKNRSDRINENVLIAGAGAMGTCGTAMLVASVADKNAEPLKRGLNGGLGGLTALTSIVVIICIIKTKISRRKLERHKEIHNSKINELKNLE